MTQKKRPSLWVGIGASVGGVAALQAFFQSLKHDTRAAYIVGQHLDPAGQHLAHEILQGLTKLPVVEISTDVEVLPGRVYLAPSHTVVQIQDGRFQVQMSQNRAERHSLIDLLFRAIAGEAKVRAVGIVLSGEGFDGTLGLKAISDAGGMTIAQAPESAAHISMPQSAISSSVVDYVMRAEEMPRALASYEEFVGRLDSRRSVSSLHEDIGHTLITICEILQKTTQHDFKHYKTSTLIRRIQRRMQVLQVDSAEDYVELLKGNPGEIDSLFKELLINVTSFFRDPEAFQSLKEEALTKILENRPSDQKVRVWIAGCSTGEEVYTIAILIKELLETMKDPPEVQIIATDIDEHALSVARKGVYSLGIETHVSQARLAKYFVRKGGRYHVSKELRELCLFSSHNLINDPPFSQLDIISCRNVLIYLGAHLQKKLIPVFHYALRAGGFLFLGNSESIASHKELFRPISAKHRIAQRKTTAIRPAMSLPGQFSAGYASPSRDSGQSHDMDLHMVSQRIVLDEFAPKYALVDDDFQVLSVSAGINEFFEPSEGVFQNQILKLVKSNLRLPLRSTLNEAKKHKRKITHDAATLKTSAGIMRVGLVVQPMPRLGDESGLFMVVFRDLGLIAPASIGGGAPSETSSEVNTALIDQLERELATVREDLDKTVQDLEASNEELKSSNEELLSMNEELQSANEELETSKEDVQEANEALQRGNNDLENLLASTAIATLFLDKDLLIQNLTPSVNGIYNVTPSDVGRPIGHFTHLASEMPPYPDPAHFSVAGVTVEDNVQMKDGRRLLRRISPYRTTEGSFSGIVVTFVDVTVLRLAEERYRELANSMPNIVWTADSGGHFNYFNRRWYDYTGFREAQMSSDDWAKILHPDDLEKFQHAWQHSLQSGASFQLEFRLLDRKAQAFRWFLGNALPVRDDAGAISRWYGNCVDIHDRVLAEERRRESEERFAIMANSAPVLIWLADSEKRGTWYNRVWLNFTGRSLEDEMGQGWVDGIYPEDRERVLEIFNRHYDARQEFYIEFRLRHHSGEYRWISNHGVPRYTRDGGFEGYVGACKDINERKNALERLKDNEALLSMMFETSPSFMCLLRGEDFIFEKVNPQYQKLVGPRPLLGRPLVEAVPEALHQGMLPILRKVLETGEPFIGREVPFRLQREAEGPPELCYIDFVYQRDSKSADGVSQILVHGNDVTAKVLTRQSVEIAKEAIENERQNFRNLFKQTPEMVCILRGPEHVFEFVNEAHIRALGFDATGMSVRKAQPESVEVHGILDRVYQTGITAELREIPVTLGDRLRYFDLTYAARRNQEGQVDGVMILGLEITEQILNRQAILRNEERFRQLAESMPQIVWTTAANGELDYINQEWARFTGLPLGASYAGAWTHIHEEDRELLRKKWSSGIQSGQSFKMETRFRRHDGEFRWMLIRAVPIRNGAEEIEKWYGTSTDIHDQKIAAEALRKAKDAADNANQAKSSFLMNISHEIRTPLGAIIGFADLLTGILPDHETARNYLARISRNSNQLARLIDELLDLSKIEANRLEVESLPVEISAVMEDVFSTVAVRAKEKGITLEEKRHEPLPRKVLTDPTRLRQILINLVGNAVKFTEKGSVRVDVQALRRDQKDILEVRVTDTGIGLSSEQQSKIFVPFIQADSSITRKYGGSGLGLALSRELARRMGGDIRIERSEMGKGSVFVLTLAVEADATEASVMTSRPGEGQPFISLEGLRILVVDDAPDNQVLVGHYLEKAKANYSVASDGAEAIEKAMAGEFDIILMDLQMPRMDGYQALDLLREKGVRLPIVALTAHALKEERDRCLARGFDAYVTKPIDRHILIQMIAQMTSKIPFS